MKRILEISIYKPGDLRSEIITLADVNAQVSEERAVFTGHATVKGQFRGEDFSGFYRLSKEYAKQWGRWEVVAARTARLAADQTQAFYSAPDQGHEFERRLPHVASALQQQRRKKMIIRKSLSNVLAVMGVVMAAAVFSAWQFYQFVAFRNTQGIMDVQGGTYHLWLAIGGVILACVSSYFVFSVFLRHDKEDVIHITP